MNGKTIDKETDPELTPDELNNAILKVEEENAVLRRENTQLKETNTALTQAIGRYASALSAIQATIQLVAQPQQR